MQSLLGQHPLTKSFFTRLVPTALVQFILVCALCLWSSGCATTEARMEKSGPDLALVKRFFVQSNLDDNHGIAEAIARALRARGRSASVGPLTLLTPEIEYVITYRDHWAWDFGDHLTYLQLAVGKPDPDFVQPLGTAFYHRNIGLRTRIDKVVDGLVGELLAARPRQGPPSATSPGSGR